MKEIYLTEEIIHKPSLNNGIINRYNEVGSENKIKHKFNDLSYFIETKILY